MAYERHWLLSWGGTLGNGSDIWANNVRMYNDEAMSADGLSDGAEEAMLDDFVKDIRALMTNPAAKIPGTVQCQWVKFNEIGPDGRYTDKSKTKARFLSGTTGDFALINGGSSGLVPTFQSVCVTTTTDRQRGPASRGRLFIPQCTAGLTMDGRIDPTQQQAIANTFATFFTALGDEAGPDLHAIAPAVVSNVGNPGPIARITGVKVGNVPDVIRRRKNAMKESYATASVTTA